MMRIENPAIVRGSEITVTHAYLLLACSQDGKRLIEVDMDGIARISPDADPDKALAMLLQLVGELTLFHHAIRQAQEGFTGGMSNRLHLSSPKIGG